MLVLSSLPTMHWQFVLITPQISVTVTCGIWPTGVVTMAIEALHNSTSSNMCTCDFPVMYALSPHPLGIHITQIYHAYVSYSYYM